MGGLGFRVKLPGWYLTQGLLSKASEVYKG